MRTYSAAIISLTIVILSCITGCRKDTASLCTTKAVIIGYDYRKCSCCGGLMINFENNPNPYSGTYYNCLNFPQNVGISPYMNFPVYMKICWQKDTTSCGNTITITGAEKW